MIERIRITHPHDRFKGRIGYIIERLDQHSLYTYVVIFTGQCQQFKRAYQRNDFKFLKSVKQMPDMTCHHKDDKLEPCNTI